MIGIMITDILVETSERLAEKKIKTLDDVYACSESLVGFSVELKEANRALKEFLMARFYNNPDIVAPMQKGPRHYKEAFQALHGKT